MDSRRCRMQSALALSQGAYFLATGIWPLLHMRSFERVTGPKVDKWLVRTVGVLITVIGGVLCSAGSRRSANAETMGLAVGAAAGLGAIDVIYGGSGRISRLYLADAAIEGAFICAWMASGSQHQEGAPDRSAEPPSRPSRRLD